MLHTMLWRFLLMNLVENVFHAVSEHHRLTELLTEPFAR